MSSETITITRFKCDRCPAVEDFQNVHGQDEWCVMSGQRRSGGPLTWGYKHDLCRACTAELAAWFRAGSQHVEAEAEGEPSDGR